MFNEQLDELEHDRMNGSFIQWFLNFCFIHHICKFCRKTSTICYIAIILTQYSMNSMYMRPILLLTHRFSKLQFIDSQFNYLRALCLTPQRPAMFHPHRHLPTFGGHRKICARWRHLRDARAARETTEAPRTAHCNGVNRLNTAVLLVSTVNADDRYPQCHEWRGRRRDQAPRASLTSSQCEAPRRCIDTILNN